ncbi:hypothetical protein TNCV_2203121 [Trichonephila clavipes]|uniref:Uncharacterized protein n=1 Tax=Trichonephila clavipes TaxID=2585209 RepID=A0A8X6S4Q8_TRICX|nr:hypothetical protein TNCV_2203121 [Trichonephila clavipes]
MPPRRVKEKFKQITEFEWGRTIGLREGGFSYEAVGNKLVYCHRCTNVDSVNSSTSAAPWITCKGAFMQNQPARQTIDGCDCNELISTKIGPKLPFQMNLTSIRGTMMAAFVLDAMPVNVAFQSALSNDIVA